ncbi:MAG TPA: sensor histidine kinase, partial [Candidatus Limnocylindria bacterium]
NAIKYSPHGGPIVVSCGVDHDGVALAVVDRGIGIPEDQLDSVFDPYTRVEASATKDVQGTGLGLPIVREIVRLHGGRVWAEPVPGGGTAFRVRLPLPGRESPPDDRSPRATAAAVP